VQNSNEVFDTGFPTPDTGFQKMKVNEGPELFDFPIKITGGRDWVLIGTTVPMKYFCWFLGQGLQRDGRPVVDETGLAKNYDFRLSFAPPGVPKDRLPPTLRERPSLFEALTRQLGLKLQPEQGPVEYLVIDHVEKSAAN
jgi:uncharacterized protein (TIGR03435 family)